MSRHGHRLSFEGAEAVCPESGMRYRLDGEVVRCIDLDEEAALPANLAQGGRSYDEVRQRIGTEGGQ